MKARDRFRVVAVRASERDKLWPNDRDTNQYRQALDLLDTQQETIDRLTAERDALRVEMGAVTAAKLQAVELHAGAIKGWDAAAAEVARLTEANAALRAERDTIKAEADVASSQAWHQFDENRELRAVNDRLIEALRAVLNLPAEPCTYCGDDDSYAPDEARRVIDVATALLAGTPVQDTEPTELHQCSVCNLLHRKVGAVQDTEPAKEALDRALGRDTALLAGTPVQDTER